MKKDLYTDQYEVGSMDMALLEKLEEQAIYIIQLNEALTFLQEENRVQKKKIENIKKAMSASAQQS